jgi:putative tricarboxylic transport membrane protein
MKDSDGSSTRVVEILTASILLAVGALVIYDSLRIGVSWAADGPQAGYFPFYIGIILALASLWLIVANSTRAKAGAFVHRSEFKRVAAVFFPAVVYVGAIYMLGIYVASALFIVFFMRLHGRFRTHTTVAVSVLVPLALFFLFEVWFLVPLPKGPLENFLGY